MAKGRRLGRGFADHVPGLVLAGAAGGGGLLLPLRLDDLAGHGVDAVLVLVAVGDEVQLVLDDAVIPVHLHLGEGGAGNAAWARAFSFAASSPM